MKHLRESERLPAITIEADLPDAGLVLLDPGPSTCAPPTPTRTRATPSSTRSYTSSTVRARWRSSVYDRAILLFTTDSEAVRRIDQACCRLDDIAGSRRPA